MRVRMPVLLASALAACGCNTLLGIEKAEVDPSFGDAATNDTTPADVAPPTDTADETDAGEDAIARCEGAWTNEPTCTGAGDCASPRRCLRGR